MEKLELLNALNDVPVYSVSDPRFSSYGRIVTGYDVTGLKEYMEKQTPVPEEGNIYVPSDAAMEKDSVVSLISAVIYGGMPVQAGYCNGRNDTYNGFEYHKSSEINIAVSDFMLVLGHSEDISYENGQPGYHISQAEVFYVPEGTVIEMFGNTLHLSPLKTGDDGFRDVVILQKGVNGELEENERLKRNEAIAAGDNEAKLLLKRSKWVIAHSERKPLISQGACPGVKGENKRLFYKEEKK